ncbi:hypothetical protein FQA39_LY10823 [Lamprigera yunnana]|nr:hypothetical protein FQA39_LY10823 [Lamprigera yunnana]
MFVIKSKTAFYRKPLTVHNKFGIHIQRSIEKYNIAVPLETVHSIIAIKAVPDIFKSGKLKLRCLATVYTLYRRTEELEVQEDAPLLALIMVPTTQSSEGMLINYLNIIAR